MIKKKLIILLLLVSAVCVSSCASPDAELLIEDQGTTAAPESMQIVQSDTGQSPALAESEDILSDNGRKVQEAYGEGEYQFKIDAEVYISSQPIQSGNLSVRNIDIGLIEQYLCDGEELIKGSTPYEYVSSGNSLDNDLDYDIRFASDFDNPGNFSYTNWRLDQYYSGGAFEMKTEEQWDSEETAFVQAMREQTETLFKNLEIESLYSMAHFQKAIEGSGTEDNCYIHMISMLDGFPLISQQMNDYMRNYCHIGERGVNGMQLSGIFQKEDERDVSVLPLDEVLAIVKEGVENKEINTFEETMDRIDLAYMVNSVNQQLTFYPVWCFSGKIDSYQVPFLCINAQTGSVAFMSW